MGGDDDDEEEVVFDDGALGGSAAGAASLETARPAIGGDPHGLAGEAVAGATVAVMTSGLSASSQRWLPCE